MVSFLETQRQIEKHVNYPARFLEHREINLLSSLLLKGEEVRKIIMTYSGLLVATNKRMIFHFTEESEKFTYKEMLAIELAPSSFIFPSSWIYLYVPSKKYSFQCYKMCSSKKEIEQFCGYVKKKIFINDDKKEVFEKEKEYINSKVTKTPVNNNRTGKILGAIGLFILIWLFGGILLSFILDPMFYKPDIRPSGAIAFIIGIIVAIKFYKKNSL